MHYQIEEYSKKGHGLTKERIEVIGGVKGDILSLLMLGGRKKKRASIEVIHTPSNERISPKCLLAGVCGGCSWQQVSYEAQLKEKETFVNRLFVSSKVRPIVGSPDLYGYRGKMEFTFSQDKAGTKYLGLILLGGRGKVINLDVCHIAHPFAVEALMKVRAWWEQRELSAYYPHKDSGSLRTLTIRTSALTGSKMVILTVSGRFEYALSREDIDSFKKVFDEDVSLYLLIHKAEKGKATQFFEMHLQGPTYFEEELLGTRFQMGPQAFFQPNRQVAEKMFSYVMDALSLTGEEKVLDLCCGIGTIGMLLAKKVRQVIGIELNPASICDAKENIERLEIDNMEVYQKDVKSFLDTHTQFFAPDIVIVDPPRTGLGEKAVKNIQELKAKTIIYISCAPATQKEDLAFFTDYEVEEMTPFDQFPHTPHIENIILLTAK